MMPLIKDIHGLDSVSFWPLAPAWFAFALLGLLPLFFFIKWFIFRRQHPKNSWHKIAYQELKKLQKDLPKMTPKTALDQYSELLRRIAIARYDRKACAGLYGQRWLDWLEIHDPKSFAWTTAGKILMTKAYSNDINEQDKAELSSLIKATFPWVKAPFRYKNV